MTVLRRCTNASKRSSTISNKNVCGASSPRSAVSVAVTSPHLAYPIAVLPRRLERSVAPRAVAEELSQTSQRAANSQDSDFLDPSRRVRVLIAGGGIAGLVLAVALLKKGVDVRIYEQDMTAIRGEGKYRGPIQVRPRYMKILLACLGVSLRSIRAYLLAEYLSQVHVT